MFFHHCRYLNSPYQHQDASQHLVDQGTTDDQHQQQSKAISKEGTPSYPPSYYPYQHPSQEIWWHQHYYQKQLKKKELKDARNVSDLIRQRNLFHQATEDNYNNNVNHHNNQILPVGFGYGMLVGGMTFMAVGVSLSLVTKHVSFIKNTFSPRAIHIGSKSITLLASLSATTRYIHNEQTKHQLKKFGTYLTPTELNMNADILCQHPMIQQAIEEQKRNNKAYYGQRSHHHHHHYGNSDYWWWTKKVQEQEILDEYHNALKHLEERHHRILQAAAEAGNNKNNMDGDSDVKVANTKVVNGFRKRSW